KLLATARKLVSHFKHWLKATENLKKFQEAFLPSDKGNHLLQAELTHWNAQYYMLDHLIEQNLRIMAALQGDKKLLLRDDQWILAANVVKMLQTFESATRKLCLKSACVSQMIPFVKTLKCHLKKSISNSILILSKHQMLLGLASGMDQLMGIDFCCMSTLLDPRYKIRFFNDNQKN
uniref:Uncharacterized protein n=1 Tax=Romanomermis culicivorax TaxID=13658 RepID=A0A915I1D6_ROMCU